LLNLDFGGRLRWIQIQVQFPALPDFLRSSCCGTRSTQPRKYINEELLERKSSGSGLENRDYGRRGSAALITQHPSIRKSWH
jgi:hypothetical protein